MTDKDYMYSLKDVAKVGGLTLAGAATTAGCGYLTFKSAKDGDSVGAKEFALATVVGGGATCMGAWYTGKVLKDYIGERLCKTGDYQYSSWASSVYKEKKVDNEEI